MKKTLLLASLLLFSVEAFAQLPGLLKKDEVVVDSLIIRGVSYPVEVKQVTQSEYHYHILNNEPERLRKTPINSVDAYVKAPMGNRSFSLLDPSKLEGKTFLIQVNPFSSTLSRFWQAGYDNGLEGQQVLKGEDGESVKFLSEMAVVNYFISQGWELYQIQNIETGEVGGGSTIFGSSIVGGSVTLSKNVYFFKAQYKKG